MLGRTEIPAKLTNYRSGIATISTISSISSISAVPSTCTTGGRLGIGKGVCLLNRIGCCYDPKRLQISRYHSNNRQSCRNLTIFYIRVLVKYEYTERFREFIPNLPLFWCKLRRNQTSIEQLRVSIVSTS